MRTVLLVVSLAVALAADAEAQVTSAPISSVAESTEGVELRSDSPAQAAEHRSDSRERELSDWLAVLLAAEAGGGFDASSSKQPTEYAGIKFGIPIPLDGNYPPKWLRTATVDLGYDRLQSRGAFSAELSLMLPIAQFPKPSADDNKNYLRIYGEPGAGHRAGGGPFGDYLSAKVMIAVFSDKRLTSATGSPSPFLEIQRRFPIASPRHGDTRLVFGLMYAICNHCGLQ